MKYLVRVSFKKKSQSYLLFIFSMAQGNQPNNRLGGFANRTFVLINGEYWDCNVNRRRIQGQVCLDEFTDILLQRIRFRMSPKIPMFDLISPLEKKGSLEVLKHALANPHLYLFRGVDAKLVSKFADNVWELKSLRNILTHEIRSWTIGVFKKFLEAMQRASTNLVQSDHRDAALEDRVNDFISKCETELKQIDQRPQLY
ncbi:hypothetical protein OUZ56_031221 [Daphnia magna]|uniref:Uncharacterized protein n=1 Tax=Daphnia magna TaxID=35525 RepID=A0ABQ9ZU50_9CRUS|nr:hypothetical protein OUZ56_031221 [Daphnia magna]